MRVFAMASQSKWSVLDLLVHSLECVAGAMLLCGRVISWPNLPGLGMRWPCSRWVSARIRTFIGGFFLCSCGHHLCARVVPHCLYYAELLFSTDMKM